MQLELLSAVPASRTRKMSILLVHGICLGAWVWEDNFLPYLADEGFPSYALSLRGHGESDGGDGTRFWRLKDFSEDLDWAVRQIDGPIVIVAHSMGGGVAQYYLRQGGRVAGLVLMASVPPYGLMRASLSMYNRNPSLWDELYKARSGRIGDVDLGILERGLFSRPIAPGDRKQLIRRLSPPALRASIELMGWPPIAPLPWLSPPRLIVGGERDNLIPPTDVYLTGAYYGVAPIIIPDCAHAIMLESQWQQAAEQIRAWLIRCFES